MGAESAHFLDVMMAQWMTVLRSSLFASFFVLKQSSHHHIFIAVLALIVKLGQMLAFPLRAAWWAPNDGIQALANILSPAILLEGAGSMTYASVLGLTAAWVLLFAILLAVSMAGFASNRTPSIAVLTVLRFVANFSATVAFIPLVQILLTPWKCGTETADMWATAGYTCFAGVHLAISLLCTALALVLIILCAIHCLFFFDSHPFSSNISSRVHGRASCVVLLCEVSLVLFNDTIDSNLPPWVPAVVCLATGLAWAASTFYFMAFYHHALNATHAICSFVIIYISIVAIGGHAGGPADPTELVVLGTPMAAALGAFAAYWRRARLQSPTPPEINASVYEVELKVRNVLQLAVHRMLAHALLEHTQHADDAITSTDSHANNRNWSLLFHSMGAQEQAQVIRSRLPPELLAKMQHWMEDALQRHPTSPLLQIYMAAFFSVYVGDSLREQGHVKRAQRLQPGLDIAFSIYCATKECERAAGTSFSSTLSRVAFEKLIQTAATSLIAAATCITSLYSELCAEVPSLERIHTITAELGATSIRAERAIEGAVSLQPRSIAALKLKGQYLRLVLNDQEKASTIEDDVLRLEDQAAGEHSGNRAMLRPLQFRMFASLPCADPQSAHVAVVSIGASNHDLGIVLRANTATVQLFGYPMGQIVRRNINLLMPPLIGKMHDSFLRRYLSSGSHSSMRGACSMLLAKHASGHIFPIGLSVQDALDSEDASAAIGGHMDALSTTDALVLLDSDWRVRGVSTAAEEVTGVSPTACTEYTIRASDLVCNWEAVARQMLALEDHAMEASAAVSSIDDSEKSIPLRDHVLLTLCATESVSKAANESNPKPQHSSNHADDNADDAASIGNNSDISSSASDEDSDKETGAHALLGARRASNPALSLGRRGSNPALPILHVGGGPSATAISSARSSARGAAGSKTAGSQSDLLALLNISPVAQAKTSVTTGGGPSGSSITPASARKAEERAPAPVASSNATGGDAQLQSSRRIRARGSLNLVRLSGGATFYVLSWHLESHGNKKHVMHASPTQQQHQLQPERHFTKMEPATSCVLKTAQGAHPTTMEPLQQSHAPLTTAVARGKALNKSGRALLVSEPMSGLKKSTRTLMVAEPHAAHPLGAGGSPHPVSSINAPGATCPFRPAHRADPVGEVRDDRIAPRVSFSSSGSGSLEVTADANQLDDAEEDCTEGGYNDIIGVEPKHSLKEKDRSSILRNVVRVGGDASPLVENEEVQLLPGQPIHSQVSGELIEDENRTRSATDATNGGMYSPGGSRAGGGLSRQANSRRVSINSAGGEGLGGRYPTSGGNGSVASSATSVSRVSARLRHALSLRQAGGFTVISLKRLYDVMRLVLLANIVIIAVMTTVLSSTFNNYAACMDISQAANLAVMTTYNGMMLSRWAVVDSMGWGTGLSPISKLDLVSATQTSATVMRGALDSLSAAANRLGGDATAALSSSVHVVSFDNAPILPISQVSEDAFAMIWSSAALLQGAAGTGTVWPVSLHGNQTGVIMGTIGSLPLLTAAYAFTSTLEALAAAEAQGDVTDSLPSYLYIAQNGYSGADYSESIRDVMLESYFWSQASKTTLFNVSIGLSIGLGGITVFLAIAVLLPMLSRVADSRDACIASFLSIPQPVLLALRAQSRRMRRQLVAMTDPESGGSGSSGDNWEEEDDLDLDGNVVVGDEEEGNDHEGELAEEPDWGALLAKGKTDRAAATRKSKRAAAKAAARIAAAAAAGAGNSEGSPAAVGLQSNSAKAAQAPATSGGRGKSSLRGGSGHQPTMEQESTSPRNASLWHRINNLYLPFLLPLVCLIGVHITMFTVTYTSANQVDSMYAAATMANERVMNSMEMVFDLGYTVQSTGYAAEVGNYLFQIHSSIQDEMVTDASLTLGVDPLTLPLEGGQPPYLADFSFSSDEQSGLTHNAGTDALVRSVLFGAGACPFIRSTIANAPAGGATMLSSMFQGSTTCEEEFNGIAMSGMQATLIETLALLRQVIAQREAATVGPYDTSGVGVMNQTLLVLLLQGALADLPVGLVNSTSAGVLSPPGTYSVMDALTSPQVANIRRLLLELLVPAYIGIANAYYGLAESVVNTFDSFTVIFSPLVIIILLVAGWTWYLPKVTELDRDVAAKRALLLLLPGEVIAGVDSLREMVHELVYDADAKR